MAYIGGLYAMLGIGYRALWAYINRSDDGISFFGKFDGLINDKISKKGNVDRLHNPSKFPKKAIF